jgi:hypothetical protein
MPTKLPRFGTVTTALPPAIASMSSSSAAAPRAAPIMMRLNGTYRLDIFCETWALRVINVLHMDGTLMAHAAMQ